MANCKENCDNNCEALDGLYEKSVSLIAYSDLINAWLNGPANGTVNIAGVNTPTLLNLVTTLKTDAEALIAAFQNRVNNIPFSIIQEGGGLYVDSNGKIYIDFDQMPTDKFEALLKSLRLPIWLSGNKNFYVNKSTGSDVLDEGRGESASKPFKTIQACIDYIANNYNVGNYTAYIIISDGTYYESLNLPAFSHNTGSIILKSASGDRSQAVIVNNALHKMPLSCSEGVWGVQDLTFDHRPNLSQHSNTFFKGGIMASSGGQLNIYGCLGRYAPTGEYAEGSAQYLNIGLFATNGGQITVHPHATKTRLETGMDNNTQGSQCEAIQSETGCQINFLGSDAVNGAGLALNGRYDVCADAYGGTINFASPRKFKPIVTNSASPYGQRYSCTSGGSINTGSNGDADFFPGAVAGGVEASTYSWYK